MAQNNSAQQQLYDLLVSKDFEPVQYNSRGAAVIDSDDADLIGFDYHSPSGKEYGTVQILFGEDGDMGVYFGDNVGRTMEPDDKKHWFSFLEQLRMFAKRHRMTFDLQNINRLKYTVKTMSQVKEGLFESLMGNSRMSWSAPDHGARMLIKHTRRLGEADQRFRHIDSIFIETTDGERFRLGFRNLAGGRAMLEHVRSGGRPYDVRGQHITEMVTELNTLARFRRAHHGRIFEGDAKTIIDEANIYYENMRRNLKRLGNAHGYRGYFESWKPADITDADVMVEDLRTMFIEQTLDQRIESALPLLARLRKNDMREVDEFEQWSQTITEGTWAVPNSPESRQTLERLLAEPLIVGPDATNATEQLYDVLGDDKLFDQLQALAMQDPDADARELITTRMAELGLEIPQAEAPLTEPQAPEQPVAPEQPTAPQAMAEMDRLKSIVSRLRA